MIHHRPQDFEHHFLRRSYFICSAAVGGSMVLSLSLPLGESSVGGTESSAPNAFISIDGDGKVVLAMPHLGIGQGIFTSIPMVIAEELEVAPNQVHLERAPPQEGFNGEATSDQRAIGSSNTIRNALKLLAEAGAAARVMLIAAAARRWGVDARLCHTHDGEVIHAPTWRKLRYGEVAMDAAYMPIPKAVGLKGRRLQSRPDQPGESG
jgi:isoquinoline 1-oxidoreductase beta subunit